MADVFTERLARVRQRFAQTLVGKIQDTLTTLPALEAGGSASLAALEATYIRIHAICGIGPTVGFVSTGQAAAQLEQAIIAAYRQRRPLQADEIVNAKTALHTLREAARRELQTTHASWR